MITLLAMLTGIGSKVRQNFLILENEVSTRLQQNILLFDSTSINSVLNAVKGILQLESTTHWFFEREEKWISCGKTLEAGWREAK